MSMPASLEPGKLESGWFFRTLKNGMKLSLRTPIFWLVMYIGIPLLAMTSKSIVLSTYLAAFIYIAGTFLCFKGDVFQEKTYVFIFSKLVKQSIWCVFIVACAVTGIILLQTYLFGDKGLFFNELLNESPFLHLSDGIFYFLMAIIFIRMIWAFLFVTYRSFRNLNANNYNCFDVFALNLSSQFNLNWFDACNVSHEGDELNRLALLPVYLLSATVLLFPPLFGLLIPWIYCIYKEIYTGDKELEVLKTNIHERAAEQM